MNSIILNVIHKDAKDQMDNEETVKLFPAGHGRPIEIARSGFFY